MVAVARRSVLIGGSVGAGLLLAGCTSGGPAPAPATPPPPDPLLAELADERRLIRAYEATIARHPALRARLDQVRADHAAHAAALVTALGPAAPATTSPAPAPSTAATPSGSPVPGTAAAGVAALRAAERAAASARGTVALTAPADRALLLAGISAAEASHVVVLT